MSQTKDDEPPTDEKNELFPLNCNIPELKLAFATFNYGQEKHFDGMDFMESHASLFHTICSIIKSHKRSLKYDQIQKPSQICQGEPQDDNVIEEDRISTESTQEGPVLTEDRQEDTPVGPVLSKDGLVVPVWAENGTMVPILAKDGQMGPVLSKDGQGAPVIAEDKQEHPVFTEGEEGPVLAEGEEGPVLAEDGQEGPVLAKEYPVLAEETQEDKSLCKSVHSKQLLASKCKSIIAGRQQILSCEEQSPAQMIPYVILINRSIPLPISIIQSLCLAKKILCRLQCFTLRHKKKKLLPQLSSVKQPILKVQTDQEHVHDIYTVCDHGLDSKSHLEVVANMMRVPQAFVTFDTLKNLQWKLYKGILKRKPKTIVSWKKSNYSIGKTPVPCPRDAEYILPLIPKNWIIEEYLK